MFQKLKIIVNFEKNKNKQPYTITCSRSTLLGNKYWAHPKTPNKYLTGEMTGGSNIVALSP